MSYEYKVIAVPRNMAVMKKLFGGGQDPGETVAGYVERLINEHAQDGWEFYRIDQVNVVEQPGCLGALLGQKESFTAYNLLTFRRPRS